MDSSLSMLLPKGIVTNSATIYQEVANYPIIPADKIYQYWHVYTTTNKKLQDPTARRLENFWWQVWGSDRRNLSGRALARIFEDISLGPTAVPLKGPVNRWEGPDAILARLRSIALPPQEQGLASVTSPANTSSGTISSTSSRAQHQPHPILKKSRGPSTSGKRPTARFVSPHGSPDHDDEDSDSFSSGSTAVTGFDVQQTASPNLKKPSVTSTPAKPTVPVPKTQKPATQQNQSNTQPPSRQKAPSSPHNAASAQQASQATVSKVSHTRQPSSRSKAQTSPKLDDSQHAHTRAQNPTPNRQSSTSTNSKGPAVRTHGRHSSGLLPAMEHAVPMRRSQSSASSERPREFSTARAPPQALFTGATASTTKVAAQGTIIEESGAYSGSVVDSSTLNDPEYAGYTLQQTPSSTSLLDSARFTPTQPSSFASLPLGRTKSQLTLLLEREKERSRDHSHRP